MHGRYAIPAGFDGFCRFSLDSANIKSGAWDPTNTPWDKETIHPWSLSLWAGDPSPPVALDFWLDDFAVVSSNGFTKEVYEEADKNTITMDEYLESGAPLFDTDPTDPAGEEIRILNSLDDAAMAAALGCISNDTVIQPGRHAGHAIYPDPNPRVMVNSGYLDSGAYHLSGAGAYGSVYAFNGQGTTWINDWSEADYVQFYIKNNLNVANRLHSIQMTVYDIAPTDPIWDQFPTFGLRGNSKFYLSEDGENWIEYTATMSPYGICVIPANFQGWFRFSLDSANIQSGIGPWNKETTRPWSLSLWAGDPSPPVDLDLYFDDFAIVSSSGFTKGVYEEADKNTFAMDEYLLLTENRQEKILKDVLLKKRNINNFFNWQIDILNKKGYGDGIDILDLLFLKKQAFPED